MNTAKSVAYGWVVLIVAAGGSYYYAKQDLKGRKLDPAVRQGRAGTQGGTMTWEDRLKEMSQNTSSNQQHDSTGPERPATRNHTEDVKMDSRPTGVDTSTSSAGSKSER